MPDLDCFKSERIAARCAVAPEHPTGSVCHVHGSSFYCALHCPACSPKAHEFTEPMPTGAVTGEQEKLFG